MMEPLVELLTWTYSANVGPMECLRYLVPGTRYPDQVVLVPGTVKIYQVFIPCTAWALFVQHIG